MHKDGDNNPLIIVKSNSLPKKGLASTFNDYVNLPQNSRRDKILEKNSEIKKWREMYKDDDQNSLEFVKWNGLPKEKEARLIIMSIFHKILIGLSLLLGFVLVALLNSKKMSLDVKRNGLLLEIIGNVSHGLDKLDSGLDTITSETKVAKGRLRQLVALHRESIIACAAMLRNKHSERSPTPAKPHNEPLVHSDDQDKQLRRST